MLIQSGIRSKPTTVKKPQSNAVCERMHKTIADILRHVVKEQDPPTHRRKAEQKIDNALSTCVHVLRCAVNHTIKTSPGAMIFNCNMLMNVQLIADFGIYQRAQTTTKLTITSEYTTRRELITTTASENPSKLSEKFKGPYIIIQVNTNGTVSFQI